MDTQPSAPNEASLPTEEASTQQSELRKPPYMNESEWTEAVQLIEKTKQKLEATQPPKGVDPEIWNTIQSKRKDALAKLTPGKGLTNKGVIPWYGERYVGRLEHHQAQKTLVEADGMEFNARNMDGKELINREAVKIATEYIQTLEEAQTHLNEQLQRLREQISRVNQEQDGRRNRLQQLQQEEQSLQTTIGVKQQELAGLVDAIEGKNEETEVAVKVRKGLFRRETQQKIEEHKTPGSREIALQKKNTFLSELAKAPTEDKRDWKKTAEATDGKGTFVFREADNLSAHSERIQKLLTLYQEKKVKARLFKGRFDGKINRLTSLQRSVQDAIQAQQLTERNTQLRTAAENQLRELLDPQNLNQESQHQTQQSIQDGEQGQQRLQEQTAELTVEIQKTNNRLTRARTLRTQAANK